MDYGIRIAKKSKKVFFEMLLNQLKGVVLSMRAIRKSKFFSQTCTN